VKKQNEEMAKLSEDRNEVVKKFNKNGGRLQRFGSEMEHAAGGVGQGGDEYAGAEEIGTLGTQI